MFVVALLSLLFRPKLELVLNAFNIDERLFVQQIKVKALRLINSARGSHAGTRRI